MALSNLEDLNGKGTVPQAKKQVAKPISPEDTEISVLLESTVPLEAPRVRYVFTAQPLAPDLPENLPENLSATDLPQRSIPIDSALATAPLPSVDGAVIQLLDERIVINQRRRKTGEVVVRKEIETLMVEVPVRREKLIVEQISPEYKQLAVVELGQVQIIEQNAVPGIDASASNAADNSRFTAANAAIQFLEAVAAQSDSQQPVQVSLAFADPALQAAYQQWLKQCAAAL